MSLYLAKSALVLDSRGQLDATLGVTFGAFVLYLILPYLHVCKEVLKNFNVYLIKNNQVKE